MSIWTHVNGSVRLDAMPFLASTPYIGKTCSFDSTDKEWDECDTPRGSEGGLNILLWTNPSPNCLAKYTVNVFGDLRDYDDEQEIIDYFNKVTKSAFSVRNGIFEIEVEGKEPRHFYYKDDEWVEL